MRERRTSIAANRSATLAGDVPGEAGAAVVEFAPVEAGALAVADFAT
jgi:hypothetical protein